MSELGQQRQIALVSDESALPSITYVPQRNEPSLQPEAKSCISCHVVQLAYSRLD